MLLAARGNPLAKTPQCTAGSKAFITVVLTLCSLLQISRAQAQETPLLSGGIGFFTSTNGGKTSYVPALAPLIQAPLTRRLQIESRATLLDIFFPNGNKGYDSIHFTALTYLQADYIATSHLTVVGGLFLVPFGTYTERLSPIWISNFQEAPLITPIGTGTGAGLGGMLRGNAYSNGKISIDYSAYFSVRSANEQFSADRSTGVRVSAYLPQPRLEVGISYGRLLQNTDANSVGFHVWWLPSNTSFQVRSEYAHTTHTQGYWIEAAYRLTRFGGSESIIGRLQPVFRIQQTFRNAPDPTDGLPATSVRQADFGLDYFLPHNVRINTSYSRLFTPTGDRNLWQTGVVYRFLFPAWRKRR